ncbi:MAG: type 4a pilus biogenesis protein PilO [Pseudomonadota bacterium]|nr:type 4a pilus biogenesis protein PilO [Pseudomonadota bacterium]
MQKWVDFHEKMVLLPRRSQYFILLGWVLCLIFIIYLFVAPVSEHLVATRTQLIGLNRQIVLINSHLSALSEKPDMQAIEEKQLNDLKKRIQEMQTRLKAARQDLVSASRMPALLEGLVKSVPGVRLVGLKTIPTIVLDTGPTPVLAGDPIYQHAVKVTVEGNYFDLLDYAQRIEQLPWQMYWSNLKLDVKDWPNEKMTITLDTLGLEQAWLSIPSSP